MKGQDNQEQQTKREFLAEWVRGVNSHGGFGTWAADVSRYPSDIHEILARHNSHVLTEPVMLNEGERPSRN